MTRGLEVHRDTFAEVHLNTGFHITNLILG